MWGFFFLALKKGLGEWLLDMFTSSESNRSREIEGTRATRRTVLQGDEVPPRG